MFLQMNCTDKLGQQKKGSLKIFSFRNSKGNSKPHSKMHPKEKKAKANAVLALLNSALHQALNCRAQLWTWLR